MVCCFRNNNINYSIRDDRVNEGVKIALTEEEAKEEAKKGGANGEYVDVDTLCNQILRYWHYIVSI